MFVNVSLSPAVFIFSVTKTQFDLLPRNHKGFPVLTWLPKIVNKHLPENFNHYTLLHLHYATFIPYICLCWFFFPKNPPGMKAPLYKAILRLSHWKCLLPLLPFDKLRLNARVARYSVPARSFMDPFIKAAYTRSGLLGAGQWSSTTGYTRCRDLYLYL